MVLFRQGLGVKAQLQRAFGCPILLYLGSMRSSIAAVLRRASSRARPFHDSWFALESQSQSTRADFSGTLATQIAAFEENGFVLLKRSTAQSLESLSQLEVAVLSTEPTPWWSGNYSVRSPEKRRSFSLKMTPNLSKVLAEAVGGNVHSLLSSQLESNSPLIDVSSIVSFPGSERQRTHSDVPFGAHKIIIGFVALSAVSLASGPTCLFAGSHTRAFHQQHVGGEGEALRRAKYYDASGEAEEIGQDEETKPHSASEAEAEAVRLVAQSAPSAALLDAGDVLLYDSSLFHFGSANVSTLPRALLMFSFQEAPPWGTHEEVPGFTYNYDESIRNKFTLESFKL